MEAKQNRHLLFDSVMKLLSESVTEGRTLLRYRTASLLIMYNGNEELLQYGLPTECSADKSTFQLVKNPKEIEILKELFDLRIMMAIKEGMQGTKYSDHFLFFCAKFCVLLFVSFSVNLCVEHLCLFVCEGECVTVCLCQVTECLFECIIHLRKPDVKKTVPQLLWAITSLIREFSEHD